MNKITIYVSIVYFLIVTVFLISHRNFFSPDHFFAVALLLTLILGKFKQFVRDWSAPTVVFLSYEYLRGLAPNLVAEAHIFPMINFDKAFFGGIPSVQMQTLFFSDNVVHWYDYFATFFYMSHFIVPMMVLFTFWIKSRDSFKKYSLALILLSYSAFVTYIFFPAMPPWMASDLGFIPHVYKIMDKVFANFPNPIDLPTVYQFVGANLVAAVPSLHAAYPVLTLLFVLRSIKLLGLIVIPYVLGVWLSIVYLGEHYVFDIVIGVLYAVLIFFLVIYGNRIYALRKIERR